MPTVLFLPRNVRVTMPAGTSLLDAASAAGVPLHAPCGGEGVCGECRVRVESGAIEHEPTGALSPAELAAGWILACHCRISDDVTLRVPEPQEDGAQIVTEASPHPGTAFPAREPIVSRLRVAVEPPAPESALSDADRLARAIRTAGGPREAACGLGVLRTLAAALRAGGPDVTVSLAAEDGAGPSEIVRVEPGDATDRALGLAIDIGTTTCAVQLVDLRSGHVAGTAADYNGQIERGLDVISRINYAKAPERLEELRARVLRTLNDLVGTVCAGRRVPPPAIDAAVVAGNPTMIHLALGLDPEHIRLEPYTPTVNRAPVLRASEVGLAMNPAGRVAFAPGVGSYVGGDITAGLLQTALATEDPAVRLFLDIGTNGEIVLGNGEWLMACACSAGPAFEGAGIRCGMRAATGAIERIRIHPETGRATVAVVGGGRPKGICGSGMFDLLAELWAAGRLTPAGKLDAARDDASVRAAGAGSRDRAYCVVPAEESGTGEAIVVTESDLQNLLRTKAALYSACALMLKHAGLADADVTQVCVAGGFGRFLDIRKAVAIGMLPDLPPERYTVLGNASLAGARALLVSGEARRRAAALAGRMTYLELNTVPSYMDEYTAALFLPHTDRSRFPSARSVVEPPRRQGSKE
jgi:uncharacterized 2Fe-2S/4Fe-4S cluster protein (DUF4445 family)